ncbi:MAG: hypothetical protein ACLRNQ_07075 [Flavonifractor plautii]
MSEYEMEERTFYWLPRSGGGLCVRERDVFLRGSHGHRVWISQRPEAGEEAYCVILKGRDRDSPTGDIRSFDFSAHLHRLEHTAVEAKAVELVFYSGRRFSMEPERYRAAMEDLFWEYGTLRRIRYLPENEAALVRTIMMEHRYQKGWMPKRTGRRPAARSDREVNCSMAKNRFMRSAPVKVIFGRAFTWRSGGRSTTGATGPTSSRS